MVNKMNRDALFAVVAEWLEETGFPYLIQCQDRSIGLENLERILAVVGPGRAGKTHFMYQLIQSLLPGGDSRSPIYTFERHLKNSGLPGSKRTISNHLHHLQEAFFIMSNDKFSFSPRRRVMNPKKIYLTDTGFANLGRPFSENRGKILENAVAVELFRQEMELYYFKGRHECDFIVKQGPRPTHAIQVCWELTSRNERRELAGLTDACESLDLPSGIVLTYSQDDERIVKGRRIIVYPVWKFLLGNAGSGFFKIENISDRNATT